MLNHFRGCRGGGGCIGRERTSGAAPGAVIQAVGGGCQSGWGRLLSVTNAVEAGTWCSGDSGWAYTWRSGGGRVPSPLAMHPSGGGGHTPPEGGRESRPPPFIDPNPGGMRVVRSAAGVPRGGGGSAGSPTYVPQNDPHDALIILNTHSAGRGLLFCAPFLKSRRLTDGD